MDRLEAMSILVAVADGQSFSSVARTTGTSLSSVSRKVRDLEVHLNTKLLLRSARRLTLTEAGRTYVASCKEILGKIREAEGIARGEQAITRGELTITAPVVFGRLYVVPIVSDFLALYPEISARLALSDKNLSLIDEHVDIALRIGPLPDSSMVAIRIGEARRVVCGSPAYFAKRGTPKIPSDLENLRCVTVSAMGGAPWIFKLPDTGEIMACPPACRLKINSAEAAIAVAVDGIGITQVLSYQAAAAVATGELEIVLSEFETPALPINLVHVGQGMIPLKVRKFLDFATPRLRKAISEHLAPPDRKGCSL